ncbi:hypothetical protein MVEN_02500600 [Mycena venus]|uniref:Uncharacterized protein n=1 Tax=Mycena venus TaxID=2733690 RepID=A0A8H6U560_9AGAR|nr:hypothetical protein MVEN_02500600 [Mycena venus]
MSEEEQNTEKPQESESSAHWEGRPHLGWHTYDLPGPFECYALGEYEAEYGPEPKTLAELRMYALSWTLRSKPEWQRKSADPEILSKWRKEVLEQQESGDLDLDEKLTEKMVDYVLSELTGYAKIADPERGIERGCFDAIWYSDRLLSDDIAQRLKSAVTVLEDVPEAKKDWHPGSNGQVLDLVHPSLYCVVYGRTHAFLPDKPHVLANLLPVTVPILDADEWTISRTFCWMPSDFTVLADGSVKLLSPYINNLHPEKHQPLYRIIEDVLTGFIPMFERVLGEIERKNKVALKYSGRIGAADGVECIWSEEGWDTPSPPEELEEAEQQKYLDSKKTLPEANIYAGELESALSPISLRERTIQCIVKLANIHLTPEQPEYAGGSWHVEGMANEHVVASGIYYYDEENITESRLSFRVATGQPVYHKQSDSECMRTLYGIDAQDECVQEIGSMVTKAGRALSWPNLFQHSVSSFKLTDPSKPGHRKILAIFLVDPTVDPIASATDVPPQQAEWAADALQDAAKKPESFVSRVPQELVDLIKGHLPTTFMTLQEAEAYRLTLMEERTAFVQTHSDTAFGVTFNMCEH